MKYSLAISNFLEEISGLSHSTVFLYFFCIDHWGRLSCLSLLFFGTLHSNGYIFPFLLCLLCHFIYPKQNCMSPFKPLVRKSHSHQYFLFSVALGFCQVAVFIWAEASMIMWWFEFRGTHLPLEFKSLERMLNFFHIQSNINQFSDSFQHYYKWYSLSLK